MTIYNEERDVHFRALGAILLGVVIAGGLIGIGIAIGFNLR